MEQFQFKFTDIYRVGNYGFSFRRIGIHLVGILLAYLIYEILVYLSIFISGSPEVIMFWNSYGILPIPPFVLSELTPLTTWAMGLGIIIFASIFFLVSTMASKITIEQLRGNVFYSIGNSIRYIKEKWLTVFGSFLGFIAFILLLLLIPVGIGLLGKIPYVGKPILTISSLFIPFAFFIGLLAVFAITVVVISLFFVPAVVSTTGADAFETIYQLFAMVWNQPWRIISYGMFLLLLQLIFVPIWAIFCITGFITVLLLTHYLHPEYIQASLGLANKWLGGTLQKLVGPFSLDNTTIFGLNTTFPLPEADIPTTICAVFITFTLIYIVGGIVAYLFSLESVGTTLIYTILRRRIDGQNLIQVIGTDEGMSTLSPRIGDE